MARKKAKTSSARSTPKTKLKAKSKAWAPREAEARSGPKFSLADEARWMSNHRTAAFDKDKKLRYSTIAFVSAGMLEGTIPPRDAHPEPSTPGEPDHAARKSSTPIDVPATAALAEMSIRSRDPSPAPSSSTSSDDEVVFRGRDRTPFVQATAASPTSAGPATTPATLRNNGKTASSNKITSATAQPSTAPHEAAAAPALSNSQTSHPNPPRRDKSAEAQTASDSDSDSDSVLGTVFKERLAGESPWMTNTTPWVSRSQPGIGWLPPEAHSQVSPILDAGPSSADAAMDDYAQNIRADLGLDNDFSPPPAFARRPLGLDAADDWYVEQAEAEAGWTPDYVQDMDGFSTSSDIVDRVEAIINKRTRKHGIQYLVVYEGSTSDDAHWLPAHLLSNLSDLALIEAFEEKSKLMGIATSSDDNDDSDDIDSTFEIDDQSDLEDDEDGDDFASDMDDERLAKVLQMQADLGLSTDEVLLYGGDAHFDADIDLASDFQRFSGPQKKRQHRGKRNPPTFPSASAMADALDADPYNGFDIMDTERPSLRPRKKGRRGQLPVELVEDSEWGEQLQATWENDRAKKRLKKAEREDLRRQGLLGRKGKGPNLLAKYKDGVDMNEIIDEIRDFMFSDMQTLSLPPMEAGRRAVIHQMVHQMGVTSKSRGDGMARFTVLSKTSRTMRVDDDFFDGLIQKKRFKNRLQAQPRVPGGRKPARPNVSYKDGDKVGASAPELGVENKGRMLLEKMGWSKGMALGAVDNKGILHPIAHTVKTTKAGLQ